LLDPPSTELAGWRVLSARNLLKPMEDYLLSTGKTNADGAERAGRWYEEIQKGKRHRDDRGRII
jgi:hypothetical protein